MKGKVKRKEFLFWFKIERITQFHKLERSNEICKAMKKQATTSQSKTQNLTTMLPYQTPRLRNYSLIDKKLGQGQFGTLDLCGHKSTSSLYACKFISKCKLLCREDYNDIWRRFKSCTSFQRTQTCSWSCVVAPLNGVFLT